MLSVKENILSYRLNLSYYCTINKPDINNKTTSKLILDYSDLKAILNSKKIDKMKFLYFNKEKVNDILCISDEIIKITNGEKINFSELFYLTLLILENKEIINYSYNINYIYGVNKYQRSFKKEILKKIIISKIVIQLINNYKESEEFKAYEENELETLEEENEIIISDNIQNLKIYKILQSDKIRNINLKKFYKNILFQLIKSEFKENEFNYNKIMKELSLEFIDISNYAFHKLYKTLNEKFKNFIVSDLSELLIINNKMNFYYIFLKYIFRKSFYIYHIKFILKSRKNIIKALKRNNKDLILFILDDEKLEYIIKKITDSEYYYEKYLKIKKYSLEDLKEVLNYYQNFLYESKKEEIIIIEKIYKKRVAISNYNYLKDLEIAKYMNKRFPIINLTIDIPIFLIIFYQSLFWKKDVIFIKL